jgi:hypothetical protein
LYNEAVIQNGSQISKHKKQGIHILDVKNGSIGEKILTRSLPYPLAIRKEPTPMVLENKLLTRIIEQRGMT